MVFAAAATLLATMGCGGTTELVPRGPHRERGGSSVAVPYPPPPAKVEVLPLQRNDECRWRGGYYAWRETGWLWIRGEWVFPPEGCYYAPPDTKWEKRSGRPVLIHRTPEWYPEMGEERCPEPLSCTSLKPVDPESQVNTGENPGEE